MQKRSIKKGMSFILLIIKMSENTLQFDNIRVNKKRIP